MRQELAARGMAGRTGASARRVDSRASAAGPQSILPTGLERKEVPHPCLAVSYRQRCFIGHLVSLGLYEAAWQTLLGFSVLIAPLTPTSRRLELSIPTPSSSMAPRSCDKLDRLLPTRLPATY